MQFSLVITSYNIEGSNKRIHAYILQHAQLSFYLYYCYNFKQNLAHISVITGIIQYIGKIEYQYKMKNNLKNFLGPLI